MTRRADTESLTPHSNNELPVTPSTAIPNETLSLYQLLDPEVLANPYPLYQRLRESDACHWDPYLHVFIVTRYQDVQAVLHKFSAERTPTPDQLDRVGLSALNPVAKVMLKQMLFLDPPAHTRLRALASAAFTPRRVQQLRSHIQAITDRLIDGVRSNGRMEVMADVAHPLPAIVTAELLGLPVQDALQLKVWSADFAEMLGNFQHNPNRATKVLRSLEQLTAYLRAAIKAGPADSLINSLVSAEENGERLTEEEVIANVIITMVGGLETTTNLIGNGLLTLLRHPAQLEKLRLEPQWTASAVEEMLRYESPSQHTARLAPADCQIGGKLLRKGQAVIAVMAAANRDPNRFPDPDRFDITRADNRHLAFGWAAHFCFGASLARMEGQIAFETMLRRLPGLTLQSRMLTWRQNMGLRGLNALPVTFCI